MGKCLGLSGVGVQVAHFYPSQNPYPSHKLAGLIRILQCCQLAPLQHSEMGIHARFRVFLLLFSTITTSAHQMDIPTTSDTSQNKAGTGERGVLHPFSQQDTYFFHTDHGTQSNYSFSIYRLLLGHLGHPTTIENECFCSFLMVCICFSLPPPNHLRKRALLLVFDGVYLILFNHPQKRAHALVFEAV
jgi:hypothetical protein